MTNIETLCYFLGITKKTWYNWKAEERPLTQFIEKYLSNEDINEFIKNGNIPRFENIELLSNLAFQEYENYVSSVITRSDWVKYSINDITNPENYLFTKVPIFTLFEYITLNDDFKEDDFAISIFKILNKYKINLDDKNNGLNEIFKINENLLSLFNIFHKTKTFNLYYSHSSNDLVSREHAFFEYCYNEIKRIQKESTSENQKYDNLYKLIDNIIMKYDNKKDYQKILRGITGN